MTVVRLEILRPEDVELVLQLAKRLQVEKIDVSEVWEELELPVGGPPMTEDELEAHLEEALTDKRVSFEEFKREMSQWK
jgi:hypothetical protein